MADLLSSLNSSSQSSGSGQTASDLLVASYKQTQQSTLDALKQKQSALEQSRSFFSTLRSKLNSINSQSDIFKASDAASKFITRGITSSDNTVLTATSTSDAVIGTNTVKVNRLASNDLLLSKQMALTDSFGAMTGTKQFDLTVNGKTQSYSVVLDGTETNEQAMKKIVNAVNLNKDSGVAASYIKNTSSTAKLTFTSKTTGGENNITFSESLAEPDPNNRLLGRLGLVASDLNPGSPARTVAAGTAAGYRSADFNDLDSQLEINGISVSRGSNSVSDVLPGVTLNLLKPQAADGQAVVLQTSVNTAGVESLIKPLLDSYNEMLKFIKSNTTQIRKDSAVSSLYSKMRSTVTSAVTTVNDGDPKYLTDIGIKIGSDGTMSISDKTKLEDLLKENPEKVSNLFTSPDGFVSKLNSAISNLTGTNGLIQSRTQSLGSQIDSTVKRYGELETKIDTRAEALRKEYESMLRTYMNAQNQYSYLNGFQS